MLLEADCVPDLQQMVNEAADPLYTAVKLAILGDSLDLMVADSSVIFTSRFIRLCTGQ
jgi:hypothetical protein